MKKFLIDTYRIFLLQTSKVIWDIVGWTSFIWFVFYNNPTHIGVVSTFGTIAGIWLVSRLYWPGGRKKAEEIEALRPVSPYIKGICNILVLLLFFVFAYGVTGFLYYDNRLIRFMLWLNNNYKLGLDLSQPPYSTYVNYLSNSSNSNFILNHQVEYITNAYYAFWCYAIPIAVAMRLKLILRIILIIVVIIFMISSLSYIGFDNIIVKHNVSFYSIYFIMIIYLIIPKRINFK